jgi:hypothetical protein
MSKSTATPTIITLGVAGWEEVADYALHLALNPTPSVEL